MSATVQDYSLKATVQSRVLKRPPQHFVSRFIFEKSGLQDCGTAAARKEGTGRTAQADKDGEMFPGGV